MERATGGERRWLRDRRAAVQEILHDIDSTMQVEWVAVWHEFLEQCWEAFHLRRSEANEGRREWFFNTMSEVRACRFYGKLTLHQFILHAAGLFDFTPECPWFAAAKPAPQPEEAAVTTANGLLYLHGQFLNAPAADAIAIARGFQCAEQLVRAMEAEKKAAANPSAESR